MSQTNGAGWRFEGEDAQELRKHFWKGVEFICGFGTRTMFELHLYDDDKLASLAQKLGCCTRTIKRWISGQDGGSMLGGLQKLATLFSVDAPPIPPCGERKAWGWMWALEFAFFKLNGRREEITRYEFECLRRTVPVVWDLETEPDGLAHELHELVRRSIYRPIWEHFCKDVPTHGSADRMRAIQSKWGVAWAWTCATLNDLHDGKKGY